MKPRLLQSHVLVYKLGCNLVTTLSTVTISKSIGKLIFVSTAEYIQFFALSKDMVQFLHGFRAETFFF